MRVRLTSAAEAEVAIALDWYAAQAPKAASNFLDDLEILLRRLSENPRQFPVVMGEIRRAGFRRFPYGLFFRVESNDVDGFACFHASRDPRHWEGRA